MTLLQNRRERLNGNDWFWLKDLGENLLTFLDFKRKFRVGDSAL